MHLKYSLKTTDTCGSVTGVRKESGRVPVVRNGLNTEHYTLKKGKVVGNQVPVEEEESYYRFEEREGHSYYEVLDVKYSGFSGVCFLSSLLIVDVSIIFTTIL